MQKTAQKRAFYIEGVPSREHSVSCVKVDLHDDNTIPWHYHPEYELILSNRGTSIFIVGNDIVTYQGSHMFLIPPNLIHAFKPMETVHQNGSRPQNNTIIVYFRKEAFDKSFFEFPEMASIGKLMIRAERVIKINGATKVTVSKKIRHLLEITDLQRIVVLLEIMDYLSKSDDVETLVSESSIKHFTAQDSDDRVHRIYHYIEENLNNSITLEKAASVANMSKTGFCRYFKYTTGETFSTYVNEVRIEYACKLLIEGKWNIAQIGYRCGFHQPSYFDRIFKNITRKTPLEFQAQFNELADKDQNLSTRFPAKCDK